MEWVQRSFCAKLAVVPSVYSRTDCGEVFGGENPRLALSIRVCASSGLVAPPVCCVKKRAVALKVDRSRMTRAPPRGDQVAAVPVWNEVAHGSGGYVQIGRAGWGTGHERERVILSENAARKVALHETGGGAQHGMFAICAGPIVASHDVHDAADRVRAVQRRTLRSANHLDTIDRVGSEARDQAMDSRPRCRRRRSLDSSDRTSSRRECSRRS